MLPGILKVSVVPDEGLFYIRAWVFFIPWRYEPFLRKKEKDKRKKKLPGKKKVLRSWSLNTRILRDAVRAIRIRKLYLDLDTDDFLLNAWLVPAFSMIRAENLRMRVNFEGSSSLLLDLRTRVGSILWILIRNKYKSFF